MPQIRLLGQFDVSSAGLRFLHGLYNQFRSLYPDSSLSDEDVKKGIPAVTYKPPHLKLLNLSPETKTTFEMSGFDMYIETFTDRAKTIASF